MLNFCHAPNFSLQTTLPLVLFWLKCLFEYSIGDGILLLVSVELQTYSSIFGCLPDFLFNSFAESGAFSSGIGVFGRSRVDQLRRKDLMLCGPTVKMHDNEFNP